MGHGARVDTDWSGDALMDSRNSQRRHSKLFSGFVIGVISVFVAILSLFIIFMLNNRPPNITVPTSTMPKVNGWDDFMTAMTIVKNVKATRKGPLDDVNMSALSSVKVKDYTTFLRAAQPVNEAVRKGLAKPYLRPPVRDWNTSSLEHSAYLRETARILAGEALCYDHIGKSDEAVELLLDCIEFGVTLPRGGNLTAGSTGVTIEFIGARYFAPIIPKLSNRELAQVADRIERIEKKRVPFNEIILEEGRSTTACYATSLRDPVTIKAMRDPRNIIGSHPVTCCDPVTPKTVLGDISYALSNKQGLLVSNLHYFEALSKEQKASYSKTSKIPVPDNPFTQGSFEMIEIITGKSDVCSARAHFTRPEAVLALIKTEVALRRYKGDNGAYPDRLSQLCPKYLKSVPVDPFANSKPLHYRKTGKTFLLYSLGPDMQDDGGKSGTKKWPGYSNGTDIVAGKY
jgi:hypothetical protein